MDQTWTCTNILRWYNGKLQQQWYNNSSGAVKWEDVPDEGKAAVKKESPAKAPKKRKR